MLPSMLISNPDLKHGIVGFRKANTLQTSKVVQMLCYTLYTGMDMK